jgi:hypothetical protein
VARTSTLDEVGDPSRPIYACILYARGLLTDIGELETPSLCTSGIILLMTSSFVNILAGNDNNKRHLYDDDALYNASTYTLLVSVWEIDIFKCSLIVIITLFLSTLHELDNGDDGKLRRRVMCGTAYGLAMLMALLATSILGLGIYLKTTSEPAASENTTQDPDIANEVLGFVFDVLFFLVSLCLLIVAIRLFKRVLFEVKPVRYSPPPLSLSSKSLHLFPTIHLIVSSLILYAARRT